MKRAFSALAIAAVVGAALIAPAALAATQGSIGATSTGSVNVSAIVGQPSPTISITGLSDISLPAGATQAAINSVCVKSSTPTYRLQVQSAGATGAGEVMRMIGPLSAKMAYQIFFQAVDGVSRELIHTGDSATGLGSSASATCAASDFASLRVSRIAFLDLYPAGQFALPDGSYTDTLTLIVSPE